MTLVTDKVSWGRADMLGDDQLWAGVSFGKDFLRPLLWKALDHFGSHWTLTDSTLGDLEITKLLNFLFLAKSWQCVVLCGGRSEGHHCKHRAHMTTRPDSHVKTAVRRKIVLRGRETGGLAVQGGSPQWRCLLTGWLCYLHFLPPQNVWCYLWNHTGTEYR